MISSVKALGSGVKLNRAGSVIKLAILYDGNILL